MNDNKDMLSMHLEDIMFLLSGPDNRSPPPPNSTPQSIFFSKKFPNSEVPFFNSDIPSDRTILQRTFFCSIVFLNAFC